MRRSSMLVLVGVALGGAPSCAPEAVPRPALAAFEGDWVFAGDGAGDAALATVAISPVMAIDGVAYRSIVSVISAGGDQTGSRSRCGVYVRADGDETAVVCNPPLAIWPIHGAWRDVESEDDLGLDFQ